MIEILLSISAKGKTCEGCEHLIETWPPTEYICAVGLSNSTIGMRGVKCKQAQQLAKENKEGKR